MSPSHNPAPHPANIPAPRLKAGNTIFLGRTPRAYRIYRIRQAESGKATIHARPEEPAPSQTPQREFLDSTDILDLLFERNQEHELLKLFQQACGGRIRFDEMTCRYEWIKN